MQRGRAELRRRQLLHRPRRLPDHPRGGREGALRPRDRLRRRGGLLHRADRADQRPRSCCWPASTRWSRLLADDGGEDAAQAIMTTDSVAKQVVVHGDGWSIGGMAKGAGMLAPQLATMLVVLTTDAARRRRHPRRRAARRHPGLLRPARLRRLHVHQRHRHPDGLRRLRACSPSAEDFTEALTRACHDLAMQLLADAEGADHEIAITVRNAATEDEAVEVGRSVARSSLFKAAVFGKDPNWGRVLASIGTTQAAFDPGRPRRRDQRRVGLPGVHARPRTRPRSTSSRAGSRSASTSRPARPRPRCGPTTSRTPTCTRTRRTARERSSRSRGAPPSGTR